MSKWMRKRLRKIITISVILSLIGCGEMLPPESVDEKNDQNFVSASELKNKMSVIVENGELPEKYIVHFGWPRISDSAEIRIKTDKVLGTLKSDQTIFTHTVSHNQTLTYVFEVLNPTGEVIDKFSKKVLIPQDLIITELNSEIKEDQFIKVNRLYLSVHPLRTNGFKVRIDADQIISEKGIIESFPENAQAPFDTDGRSAGELLINSKIARGELKIIMQGEHGGNGSKGKAIAQAGAGSRGSSGQWLCEEKIKSIETVIQFRGYCGCHKMGSQGGAGANGEKGNQGLAGKSGGDSGFAKINIVIGDELNLTTFSIPGLAGKGGEGGDGQPGGAGGPGFGDRCSGENGPSGATGAMGDQGLQGLPGKKGTFCTYIASEKFNECQ